MNSEAKDKVEEVNPNSTFMGDTEASARFGSTTRIADTKKDKILDKSNFLRLQTLKEQIEQDKITEKLAKTQVLFKD